MTSNSALHPDDIARLFHETYERLAPSFGYETRKASAVPWEQVPETNRKLMTAVADEVAAHIIAQAAEKLRSVAAGRRQYLNRMSTTEGNVAQYVAIEDECRVMSLAADIVEGDLRPLFGWLPSWLWTDEMNATLNEPAQRIQRETPPPPA